MCCSSKKKPVQTQVQNNVQTSYVSNSNVPRSVVKFSAVDYESSPMNDQAAFVSTKRSQAYAQAIGDRQEDYSREINTAKESRLIQPKQILTYDLDREDGVSKTPVINTFHYESQLSHCFLHNNGNNLNNSNVYRSEYQNNNVNNSGLYNSGYNNANMQNSSFKATDSAYINRSQAQQAQNANLSNSNLQNHEDSRISKNSKTSK